MRFYFSYKVTLVCATLAALMVRASIWQADRYHQKLEFIAAMQQRLRQPVEPFADLVSSTPDWGTLTYRRVQVAGEFDFSREVTLRNRMLDGEAGVHLITPLRLNGGLGYVLVNRGFIPLHLSTQTARKQFQALSQARFVALIKESAYRRFLAPQDDPAGAGLPWNDSWLRVNISAMQKQLPYPALPIFLELMPSDDPQLIEQQIVKAESGKAELLIPGFRAVSSADLTKHALSSYPIPAFDPVVPPGRHYQYIFEWAFMALITALIGLVLQLRPANSYSNHAVAEH